MFVRLLTRRFGCTGCVLLALLTACSLTDKPALPRRARLDTADATLPPDELREVLDRADIVYLPSERLESDEQSGAALRLLNVLQQSTTRGAVGWGNVAADLERSFDEWNAGQLALDAFLDRVRFVSGSQRDAARRLLRESRERGLTSVPLSCASGLICTADNIVREFNALGGGKLVVVIDRRDLDASSGVPFFVAQRVQARQVVLDPRAKTSENGRLLTGGAGASEIVNAAPRASRDGL